MPKVVKVILGIGAVMAALAVVGVGAFLLLFKDIYYTTTPDTWETVTKSSYSMMMPKGMKEAEDVELATNQYTLLDCVRNRYVIIATASYTMSKEERKITQRMDVYSMLTQFAPDHYIDGVKIEPQKRNDMIYWEYSKAAGGEYYSYVEASYVSETSIYAVTIACRKDNYDDFKGYIFEWLDSFTPSY